MDRMIFFLSASKIGVPHNKAAKQQSTYEYALLKTQFIRLIISKMHTTTHVHNSLRGLLLAWDFSAIVADRKKSTLQYSKCQGKACSAQGLAATKSGQTRERAKKKKAHGIFCRL